MDANDTTSAVLHSAIQHGSLRDPSSDISKAILVRKLLKKSFVVHRPTD
jgi:hypothetical protein